MCKCLHNKIDANIDVGLEYFTKTTFCTECKKILSVICFCKPEYSKWLCEVFCTN